MLFCTTPLQTAAILFIFHHNYEIIVLRVTELTDPKKNKIMHNILFENIGTVFVPFKMQKKSVFNADILTNLT